MLTQTRPDVLAAYVPRTHAFKVILRDRLDQEDIYTVKADNDRFCNLVALVRTLYPGRSIVDSWEIPA